VARSASGPLPPGWPDAVRPPQTPEWERSAVAWLFDLCPPDYRAYDVLRRYPLVLARLAREHCQVGVEAARRGLATVRAELAGAVPPEAVEATVGAYEREGARLSRAAASVALVEGALRGERWVPRL
jgi:hypothetical protein